MGKDMMRQHTLGTSPHGLLHWEQPILFLQRVLRVYPNEIKLLLWVTLIQLAMRMTSVLINNFAQTAFLKRYGVEHLPTIFLIEAVLTFFFASAVGVLMERHRTLRVFTGLLLFFSLSAFAIRLLLPFNILLIYPILYILKSQAIEILPILYWDILTDLFTTQQSKRLYTLITAGGVLGTTLGSFLTGPVARWVGVDNVLLIFVGGMILAALLNELTEKVVGAPLQPRKDRRRTRARGNFKENLQAFMALTKDSPLLKYMILIIAIPNILLPIMTYQFNVVVDNYFAAEQSTLNFFGIFRGVSNAVMFGLLLFTGRLVMKWGVPVSLLFHPINYLIAFLGLLFRFDIVFATYARFSTETLKTVLNNPARAVLFNFFPSQMRGLARVFLRGNVVRAADFTGSGFLMLIRGLMDPRLLSLVAAPLVLIWVFTTVKLKKAYASMIIQTLMDKQIDWERLEHVDFQAWLNDKAVVQRLHQGLGDKNPDVAVTCGEILAKLTPPSWAKWIVEALPGKPLWCQKALLDFLRPEDAREIMGTLLGAVREASTDTLAHLTQTLNRLDPQASLPTMMGLVDHPDPRIRVEAMVGLYLSYDPQAQSKFQARTRELLDGRETERRMAVQILGRTGDPAFAQLLLHWASDEDADLKAQALLGLGKMRHEKALDIALSLVGEQTPQVRKAALQVMIDFAEETPLDHWVQILGDKDPMIRHKATLAIRDRKKGVVQALLAVLHSPSRTLRKQALSILEELGAPRAELSRFVMGEMEKAYRNLVYVQHLKDMTHVPAIVLLMDHLMEKNNEIIEVVLRVLGVMEFADRMRIILKAIQSGDRRDMDNAIEVLETSLHSDIREILIPLLEERPLEEKLRVGYKTFDIDLGLSEGPQNVLIPLTQGDDSVTQALALYALGAFPLNAQLKDTIAKQIEVETQMVREAALWARGGSEGQISPGPYPIGSPNLIEKLVSVRKIPLFSDLRIRELAVIAAITDTKRFQKNEVVVREGDPGDALYLIMEGQLSVIKAMGAVRERVLDSVGKDDFFGEMALLDRKPRSASVRTDSECLFLVIKTDDFTSIMENHPAIPINICKILGRRIRALQTRLQGHRSEFADRTTPC
ncbi:MAG: HEAT repeat domain-containing protein [Deltaproteobacteria bacterium]|nr:MAG: HEAT repeat domain-containing protein [Deltaproteobacteria bacterium]